MLNYPEKISYSQITERKKITRHKRKETPAELPQKPTIKIEKFGDTAEAIARLSHSFKELNQDEKNQAVEYIRKDLKSQSKERHETNEKPSV